MPVASFLSILIFNNLVHFRILDINYQIDWTSSFLKKNHQPTFLGIICKSWNIQFNCTFFIFFCQIIMLNLAYFSKGLKKQVLAMLCDTFISQVCHTHQTWFCKGHLLRIFFGCELILYIFWTKMTKKWWFNNWKLVLLLISFRQWNFVV